MVSARSSGWVVANHEDHAVGRLFERFQQRVGSFVGEHVRFVENHHFAAGSRRRVTDHLAQFANLVDAAVGSRVDFDDVERSAGGDFAAGIAHAAGFRGRSVHAIQRLGENARRGGFSHAARAGKNVSVRHAVVVDRVGQRFGYVLLPD